MSLAAELVDLGDRLTGAGFVVTTQQHLAAGRVLVLTAELEAPLDRHGLALHLAPIYCTNAAEQERFGEIFASFYDARTGSGRKGSAEVARPIVKGLRRVQTVVRGRWPRLTVAVALFAALASVVGPLAAWAAWQHLRIRSLSGSVTAGGAPLAGVEVSVSDVSTATGALGEFSVEVAARMLPVKLKVRHEEYGERSVEVGLELEARRRWLYLGETRDVALPALPSIELGGATQDPIVDVVIEPPPEATLEPVTLLWTIDAQDPEVVPPASVWRRLRPSRGAIAAAPLIVMGALLLRRRGRRAAARRERSREPRSARRLKLTGEGWRIGRDLHLSRLGRDLRRRRMEVSQELQIAATIRSTVQRGGLFTPEFGSRVEAEYLVLVDSRGRSDHQARLSREILVQLEASGVILEVFTFDGDAGLCQRLAPKALRRDRSMAEDSARPLTEGAAMRIELLRSRLPQRRVLVVSDGAGLFDTFTGQARSWLRTLLEWPDPILISTRPRTLWGEAEAAAARMGLVVVACESEDLERLARVYDGGKDSERERSIADATGRGRDRQAYRGERASYERRVGRWIDADTPPMPARTQLLRELRDPADLGSRGFLWAAACAAYPELHWDLTLRLGERLVVPEERAGLLPRLSRLVWFRESFMPDWLRDALLGALSPAEEERARACVREILSVAVGGSDREQGLELALDPKANAFQRLRAALVHRWRRWRERRRLDDSVRAAEADSPLRDHVFLRFLSRGRMGRLTQAMPRELLRVLFPEAQPILGTRPIWALGVALVLSLVVGILLGALSSGPTRVASMAFSPDGKLVATGFEDGGVIVWDVESKNMVGSRFGPRARVTAMDLAPDGMLVTASDEMARVWNARTGSPVGSALSHGAALRSVDISPDGGNVLTCAYDGSARLWDVESGRSLGQFAAMAASFDDEGRRVLLLGREGSGVAVVDTESPQPGARFDRLAENDEYTVAALASQGRTRVLTGGADGRAQYWELSTRNVIATVADASAAGEPVADVGFSPDGSRAVAVADSWAYIVNATTGGNVTSVRQTGMGRARFSADGRLLVTSDLLDGNAQVWDSATGAPIGSLLEYTSSKPFLVSPVGNRLLTSDGISTRVWSLPTAEKSRSFALLVANNYPGTASPLRGAALAEELAAVLRRDFGFGVTLLAEASRAQILLAFQKLEAILQPEDRLLLVFSGSGYSGEFSGNPSFEDARYAFVASSRSVDPVSLVGSDELARAWSLPARQVLFVVDTSYGDQLVQDWSKVTPPTEFGAREVLIASRQPMAWEGPTGSAFMIPFLAELRSTRGGVTSSELFSAIERRMALAPVNQQLPDLQHWGADGSFTLPRRLTSAVPGGDTGETGDAGETGGSGGTGGTEQTTDSPTQGPSEPVITVEGPTTGLVDEELTFTAYATGCAPDGGGWSWKTASFETSAGASAGLTYSWTKAGPQFVEASNLACGTVVGRAQVTIEERIAPAEQSTEETGARQAALQELMGRPIRFVATNESEEFAIKGRFVGVATVKGEMILVAVDESTLSFPRPAPDGQARLVDSVEANLACRSREGAWAVQSRSRPEKVGKQMYQGDSMNLGSLDYQISLPGNTEPTACWVAFAIQIQAQASPSGTSYAHAPRDMFASPRATAN